MDRKPKSLDSRKCLDIELKNTDLIGTIDDRIGILDSFTIYVILFLNKLAIMSS